MRERSTPRRSRRTETGGEAPPFEPLPSWRLPSGLELAEFALQGGFLMPALMEAARTGEAEDRTEERTLAGSKR